MQTFMTVFIIMCVLFGLMAVFVWAIDGGGSSEGRLAMASLNDSFFEYINNIKFFNKDIVYISIKNSFFIVIDDFNRSIAIGSIGDNFSLSHKIINSRNILSVDFLIDGKELSTSSSNSGVLGAAAVGGILFGVAGAVTGAIYASGNKNHRVNEVILRILLDDISCPYIYVNFLENKASAGTPEYNSFVDIAEQFYNIISIFIKRNNKDNSPFNFIETESRWKIVLGLYHEIMCNKFVDKICIQCKKTDTVVSAIYNKNCESCNSKGKDWCFLVKFNYLIMS